MSAVDPEAGEPGSRDEPLLPRTRAPSGDARIVEQNIRHDALRPGCGRFLQSASGMLDGVEKGSDPEPGKGGTVCGGGWGGSQIAVDGRSVHREEKPLRGTGTNRQKRTVTHESDRTVCFEISGDEAGERLDAFLASRIDDLTRSRGQEIIRAGLASVNERKAKASYHLKAGDVVSMTIPRPRPSRLEPEPVDFTVVHEDESLLVLDKPAGLVVHPAPGHASGTLVHGLLAHCKDLSGIGGEMRPGIVHRLDKDTSGLMVVAKNDRAHESLARQFKEGGVRKEYIAFVHGRLRARDGMIDLPIGRDPRNRKRMAVVPGKGKAAITLWRVVERWGAAFTHLEIRLKTGRTHQIRVHLSHEGYPLVGDPVYGPKRNWWKHHHPVAGDAVREILRRQMLHARSLGFVHPATGAYSEFTSPMPGDMVRVREIVKAVGEGREIP